MKIFDEHERSIEQNLSYFVRPKKAWILAYQMTRRFFLKLFAKILFVRRLYHAVPGHFDSIDSALIISGVSNYSFRKSKDCLINVAETSPSFRNYFNFIFAPEVLI